MQQDARGTQRGSALTAHPKKTSFAHTCLAGSDPALTPGRGTGVSRRRGPRAAGCACALPPRPSPPRPIPPAGTNVSFPVSPVRAAEGSGPSATGLPGTQVSRAAQAPQHRPERSFHLGLWGYGRGRVSGTLPCLLPSSGSSNPGLPL